MITMDGINACLTKCYQIKMKYSLPIVKQFLYSSKMYQYLVGEYINKLTLKRSGKCAI